MGNATERLLDYLYYAPWGSDILKEIAFPPGMIEAFLAEYRPPKDDESPAPTDDGAGDATAVATEEE